MLQVDTEKLAFGLEAGAEAAGFSVLLSDMAEELIPASQRQQYLLRTSLCGFISSAIDAYLDTQGVASRLVVSQPRLDFEPDLMHVMTIASSETEDGPADTVIDGTYSQFFEFIGLTPVYEAVTGTRQFPEEKILVFEQGKRLEAVDKLADIAVSFQAHNIHPCNPNDPDQDLGDGPLAAAPREVIHESFAEIWNPTHFRRWPPWNFLDRKKAIETIISKIPEGTVS